MTDTLICEFCENPFPESQRTEHDREHNPDVPICADCLADFKRDDS